MECGPGAKMRILHTYTHPYPHAHDAHIYRACGIGTAPQTVTPPNLAIEPHPFSRSGAPVVCACVRVCVCAYLWVLIDKERFCPGLSVWRAKRMRLLWCVRCWGSNLDLPLFHFNFHFVVLLVFTSRNSSLTTFDIPTALGTSI